MRVVQVLVCLALCAAVVSARGTLSIDDKLALYLDHPEYPEMLELESLPTPVPPVLKRIPRHYTVEDVESILSHSDAVPSMHNDPWSDDSDREFLAEAAKHRFFFKKIGKFFKKAVSKVGGFVKKVGGAIGKVAKTVVKGVTKIGGAIVKAVKSVPAAIKNVVKKGATFFKKGFDFVKNNVKKFGKTVFNGLKKVGAGIVKGFKVLGKGLAKVGKVLKDVCKKVCGPISTVLSFIPPIPPIGTILKAVSVGLCVAGTVSECDKGCLKPAGMVSTAGTLAGCIAPGGLGKIGKVVGKVAGNFGKVTKGFSALSKMGKFGKNASKWMEMGKKILANPAIKKFTQSPVMKKIKGFIPKIDKLGAKIGQKASKMNAGFKKFGKTLNKTLGKGKKFIKKVQKSKFFKKGKAIYKKAKKVYNKVQDTVEQVQEIADTVGGGDEEGGDEEGGDEEGGQEESQEEGGDEEGGQEEGGDEDEEV